MEVSRAEDETYHMNVINPSILRFWWGGAGGGGLRGDRGPRGERPGAAQRATGCAKGQPPVIKLV